MLPIAHGHGWSLTMRPHRANALFSWSWLASAAAAALRPPAGRRGSGPRPGPPPRNAGTRVSAESIVTATTIAEASAQRADERRPPET